MATDGTNASRVSKKTRLSAMIGGILLAATASAAVAQPADPTRLSIRADQPGATISRDIFGQFAEQLGEGINGGVWVGKNSKIPNVRGIRSDVVAALKALRVPNVRWPGGCFADAYDWRDGVGPRRTSHVNQWGNVIEPNSFGTNEFLDFVDQIGSEAYISVNVGSGTPQQAAEWFEYMTVELPTTLGQERVANGRKPASRIKYLGLGNESWGCGGGMSADAYVEKMKLFATFTKSHHPDQVESFIKPAKSPMIRVAVGQGLGETAYTEAVMKAWKERTGHSWNIQALSLHYYTGLPLPMMASSVEFGEKDYAGMLASTLKMEDMLSEHSAIMDKYDPGRKVALAVDEWGLWLRPQGENFLFLRQQNSVRDAIAAALNLNIFARHADRVRLTNIAQMVNVIQSMILTDGAKMLLTPTYHVYRMYVPFQDARFLPVSLSAGSYRFDTVTLPRVDAIAAKGADGKVWLAVTNVDPNRPAEIDVAIPGVTATAAVGDMLTAPTVNAVNSFDAPQAVSPVPFRAVATAGRLTLRLPPKSVTVVQVQE
ncbi:alpha-N-arabinofuranosidase [Sphingobium sufflavum]|uniref:alpha-N-arabinofuranosidase n=1 Tax=Sphingobium sufflavum TaxID=1129547 RepID=UPI001F37A8E4|nr:alpha-L-arabinofuranosidase C-terminal domain-containing protein [Sphingobium sufflavum]MCE7795421.1 alpha-N-arabinofuranosidase [Sphingobium sufflavum]